MPEVSLFYSWQSDLPRSIGRDLIRKALSDALARIAVDSSVEDAPRLDHDTQGLAGTPQIAESIFRKIDRCGLFLADVSFIGASVSASGDRKPLPNPNVLLELGYAAARLGWSRVILVMNTAFGPAEDLIFDLRHRRFPIAYQASADSGADRASAKKGLSARIEEAVRAGLQLEHDRVFDTIARLDMHCVYWLEQAGNQDAFTVPPRQTMGHLLGLQRQDDALVRLIGLELLHCVVARKGTAHAYRWTYLGKLVLKHLGFRTATA